MQAVDTIDGIITAPVVFRGYLHTSPYPTSTLSCPPGLKTEMEVAENATRVLWRDTHIMTLVYTMAWHASHSLSLTYNVKVAHVASS
jgi:hypothetical protein